MSSKMPTRLGAMLGILICALSVAIAVIGMHADVFQHETHKLLSELNSAKGIYITLTPRHNSTLAPDRMLIHGYIFPRVALANQTATGAGVLEFDGRISYEFLDRQYNFTMLDNRGYVTVEDYATGKLVRHACLHPRNLPPMHAFTDALANARVIDDVANFDVDCSDGKLVEFVFAGEPFVYCYKGEQTQSSTSTTVGFDAIHSETMAANVQFLRNISDGFPSRNSLLPPSSVNLTECKAIDQQGTTLNAPTLKSTVGAVIQAAARRAQDVVCVATRSRRLGEFDGSDCDCKEGMKACLFVHGMGKKDIEGVGDNYEDYWGDIKSEAKCCSSIKFMYMDTIHNTWYDEKLPKQMCNAALALVPSADKMSMQNIALIGHSMGNLIIASAAMRNLCAIGPGSKWIALQGPITGSKSTNKGIIECAQSDSLVDKGVLKVLSHLDFCPITTAARSMTFMETSDTPAELNVLYARAIAVYKQYVTSGLCGVEPAGLATVMSAEYVLLGQISGHTSKNDGVVEFKSCRGGLDEALFGTSWRKDKFYKAGLNHMDGRFTNGDGFWGDDRKPIKWFNCQF
ncbi:hypothetical protein Gpo141_00009890 [Globisporangium polare]